VSLSALSDEDTARLLHELLGSVLPAETQVELLARAGGNPLYAEEFVRMLRDRGQIGELPETVQGLIAARLDLLEEEQKTLLQDAAVVGKRFWAGALAALGDRPSIEADLHGLERKEFVRRERASAIAGDREYGFRHLLVRDVAYGQIPRVDRAEKHLLAARWIERLGRREDHAEMLAHHYLQALELIEAAGGSTAGFAADARAALTDAGDRATALNAYDAAVRYFRVALELLGELDAPGPLLLRLGKALAALGETDFEILQRAKDELLATGDEEGAAHAETELTDEYWLRGDRDAAMEHMAEARRLVEPLPASEAKARVIAQVARLLMLSAQEAEAIRVGEEGLAMAEALGAAEVTAAALINIGSARAALGGDRGLDEIARGVEVARAANAAFEMCRGMGNLAARLWARGQLAEAKRRWHEAELEAENYGQKGFARWFRGVLVPPEVEFGEWDPAVERADAFIADVEAGLPHYLASQAYCHRALIRLGRGEADGALTDAELGLELARRAKDPQALYPSCAVAAHVFIELGERERALAPAEEFLAGAAEGNPVGFAEAYWHQLSWTLTEAGRGEACASALEHYGRSPFAKIGLAFARGDPGGAADQCGEIGALASEAYCRLAAARAGDLSQLERALAFYRSVGATRYLREGETLLAASA
jgi:tetratricopeptide (TPR) repeat protein